MPSATTRLSFSEPSDDNNKTKYYKLIKDLPTFEAGDVFKINRRGHLEYVKGTQTVKEGQELIAYTKMTLDKFPTILKDWFEELPDYTVYKKWRAKIGERYCFVSDDGRIFFAHELGTSVDDNRWRLGNYFKTENDAKKYRNYLEAFNTLLTDSLGGEYVDGGDNWVVYYDCDEKMNKYDYTDDSDFISMGGIWFQDINDLEESLRKHRDEWNIVRDYRRKKK